MGYTSYDFIFTTFQLEYFDIIIMQDPEGELITLKIIHNEQ